MMWDVIGQEKGVAALRGALARGQLAHAYLFVGPPDVGKATLARNLAQAVNCTGVTPPCGECAQCQRIAQGMHADVQTIGIQVDGDRAHKEIRIDQIREVERTVSLRPFEGHCRVVIIDPADAMNEEAQNAFLKTLEEPPGDVVFVLITINESGLLQTIRSRCQRLEFVALRPSEIEQALRERWGTAPEEAKLLARVARGRLGWAIRASQDRSVLEQRNEAFQQMRELLGSGLYERFNYAANLASRFTRERSEVLGTFDLWQEWWRDILLILAGCDGQINNQHLLTDLREMAALCDMSSATQAIAALGKVQTHLGENANARLTIEVLLLDLPQIGTREGEARRSARAPAH